MGEVIENAKCLLAEAKEQEDGSNKKENIAYWRAFLCGANAQLREDLSQGVKFSTEDEMLKLQKKYAEIFNQYANAFQSLSLRVERVYEAVQEMAKARDDESASGRMALKKIEASGGNTKGIHTIYTYGSSYSVDSLDD